MAARRDRPGVAGARGAGPAGVDHPRGGPPAYTTTWALGSLAPGKTARFVWHVTVVRSGTYVVVTSPKAFGQLLRVEMDKWGKVAREVNLRVD